MQIEQGEKDGVLQKPVHDGQTTSPGLRVLLNTFRLAESPGEVAGLLGLFCKFFARQLKGSSVPHRDEMLRLHGVTHVFGMGTFELAPLNEIYSEQVYDRLPDFVPQPGWVVFDVGANVGIFAVRQALRGAYVYAFEPNPDCYRRLQKSLRANNVESRVTALNYALDSTAGPAELFITHGITLSGSVRPLWPSAGAGTGLKIERETLDRAAKALQVTRIDLLKLDVEGLELDVLQGACETLPFVDRLIVEYHSLDLRERLVTFLASHDLTVMLDEETNDADENLDPGIGRGLLYARRRAARDVQIPARH
jgi:FkbM family methyltransferase